VMCPRPAVIRASIIGAMRGQSGEGRFLVLMHEAAVPFNVRRKNGSRASAQAGVATKVCSSLRRQERPRRLAPSELGGRPVRARTRSDSGWLRIRGTGSKRAKWGYAAVRQRRGLEAAADRSDLRSVRKVQTLICKTNVRRPPPVRLAPRPCCRLGNRSS
jgi:hypothetical protein